MLNVRVVVSRGLESSKISMTDGIVPSVFIYHEAGSSAREPLVASGRARLSEELALHQRLPGLDAARPAVECAFDLRDGLGEPLRAVEAQLPRCAVIHQAG